MEKVSDYAQFAKLRLSVLVVFSAVTGFLMGTDGAPDFAKLFWLTLGGFLVTASSNGFNQVIEREEDKLMTRTSRRPLPDNRMTVKEAVALAAGMGIAGIAILGIFVNNTCAFLGLGALLLYATLYTPLKKISPLAVFAGAFPGAIPPLLGWIAATGTFGLTGWVMFGIQFIWQFPHFWAIAWVLDDDYKRAGFRMLPSPGGRDKASAFQTMVYTFGLLPLGLIPFAFRISGWISAIIITLAGIIFLVQAVRLYKKESVKAASSLMFGSFLYLPVVQIALVLDKI
jgi:protoheme IX farnesyltransferase